MSLYATAFVSPLPERRLFADPASRLTTSDVARLLQLTPRGVRWLVHDGRLPAERTRAGHFLFRPGDVQRLNDRRAKARLEQVATTPRLPNGVPVQLRLRLVTLSHRRSESLPIGEVESADSFGNRA